MIMSFYILLVGIPKLKNKLDHVIISRCVAKYMKSGINQLNFVLGKRAMKLYKVNELERNNYAWVKMIIIIS